MWRAGHKFAGAEQLRDFLDNFRLIRRCSRTTAVGYWYKIRAFLLFAKSKFPRRANMRLIHRYVENLQARRMTNTSICHHLNALRSFFGYLEAEKKIKKSPLKGVNPPKRGKRIAKFLSLDSISKLLALPDVSTNAGRRDKAIIDLLFSTGLRRSEVAGLKRADLDLPGRMVRVIGKGGKERVVPIRLECVENLENYLNNREDLEDVSLFCLSSSAYLYNRIKTYLVRVDPRPGICLHSLRHSFATHFLAAGAGIRTVQELLGHDSITSTQIYTHIENSAIRREYDLFFPRLRQLEPEDKNQLVLFNRAKGEA